MTEEVERWLPVPIPAYASKYSISSWGRIRHEPDGRIRKESLSPYGYRQALLFTSAAGHHTARNARMVALAFIGPKPGPGYTYQVNHIDGNKLNDHVENLEWITQQENIAHAVRTGLHVHGIRHAFAKLDDEKVRVIRSLRGLVTHRELASRFNVTSGTIGDVLRGKTWKHVR